MDKQEKFKVESSNIYIVEITEIQQRLITIEANSKSEAISNVKDSYYNNSIRLGENDVISTEFEIFNYNDISEISELIEKYLDSKHLKSSISSVIDSILKNDKATAFSELIQYYLNRKENQIIGKE